MLDQCLLKSEKREMRLIIVAVFNIVLKILNIRSDERKMITDMKERKGKTISICK